MRSRTFIAVAALLAVLVGGITALYLYDRSGRSTIAKGVRVAGVDVGGLKEGAARAHVVAAVRRQTRRPVLVTWHGRRFVLHPQTTNLRRSVATAVAEAVARSQEGSIFTRVARRLRGGSLHARIAPAIAYSPNAARRLAARVARVVDRAPHEASLAIAASGPSVTQGRSGRTLQRARLRSAVDRALRGAGPRRLTAPVSVVRPHTTTAALAARYPTIIVVDRADFRLSLYKDMRLQKTYPVAVGRQGLETPGGLYHVQDKQVDPSWHVPNSSWAGALAGKVIPPGPQDPIKARWMGIYNGAGIHGTDELSSLGSAASHGCIRMAIPDVIELFDQTRVGAPVFIA